MHCAKKANALLIESQCIGRSRPMHCSMKAYALLEGGQCIAVRGRCTVLSSRNFKDDNLKEIREVAEWGDPHPITKAITTRNILTVVLKILLERTDYCFERANALF